MDTNVNIGNELKENYTEERNKLINVYKKYGFVEV